MGRAKPGLQANGGADMRMASGCSDTLYITFRYSGDEWFDSLENEHRHPTDAINSQKLLVVCRLNTLGQDGQR